MTLYNLTPISQKPEIDGTYRIVSGADLSFSSFDEFKNGKWNSSSQLRPFWLRPIPEEELRKLLGDAFDAGIEYHHFSDGPGQYAPDKETYINNVLNQQ